jgi:hypothetical protein
VVGGATAGGYVAASGQRLATDGVRSVSTQWLVRAGGRGHERVGVGEN